MMIPYFGPVTKKQVNKRQGCGGILKRKDEVQIKGSAGRNPRCIPADKENATTAAVLENVSVPGITQKAECR